MINVDFMKEAYISARQELMERIKLRDNIIVVYLGALGVILGVVFTKTNSDNLLFIIPFLAIGCSFLISQHNSMIGVISVYITREIWAKMPKQNFLFFDNSIDMKDFSPQARALRTVGHLVFFALPSILTVGIMAKILSKESEWQILIWYICLILTLGILFIIGKTHTDRKKAHLKNWNIRDEF